MDTCHFKIKMNVEASPSPPTLVKSTSPLRDPANQHQLLITLCKHRCNRLLALTQVCWSTVSQRHQTFWLSLQLTARREPTLLNCFMFIMQTWKQIGNSGKGLPIGLSPELAHLLDQLSSAAEQSVVCAVDIEATLSDLTNMSNAHQVKQSCTMLLLSTILLDSQLRFCSG